MMATYRGVPYEAGVGPYGSDVVLFAACPPPEELGFEPATGHWRKRVIRAEVDALWESRPVGIFRDEPCIVLDDLGDRLHIAYLGDNPDYAASLGYWQVDRGVFELLTPREEVSGLTEERVDKPLLSTQPPTGASLEASYPYHPAPLPPPPAAPLPPAAPPPPPAAPPPPPAAPPPLAASPLPPAPPLSPAASPLSPAGIPPLAAASPPAGTLPRRSPVPPPRPPATHPLDGPTGDPGGRAARRQRVPTRDIFSELADLAAIPRTAYALETEADGALCLVPTPEGFEVFVAMDGARHEARSFSDEEAAYFYLFGVLAAEAIRNGTLVPSVAPAGARHDLS
jgi:hypothetical protein